MKISYLHLLCAIALCGFVRLDKLVVQHTTPSDQMENTTATYPCLSLVDNVYDNTKDDVELYTHTKWPDLTTFYRQQPALFYRCDEGNVSSSHD